MTRPSPYSAATGRAVFAPNLRDVLVTSDTWSGEYQARDMTEAEAVAWVIRHQVGPLDRCGVVRGRVTVRCGRAVESYQAGKTAVRERHDPGSRLRRRQADN